ncbi:MAG TPA: XRE family transcriptional regulator [Streptosporangiaceae bacterium]
MAAQRDEAAVTAAAGWYGPGRHWQEPARSPAAGPVLPPTRSEVSVARQVRARGLATGCPPAEIAAAIAAACGTTRIRAFRLALGVSLPDVVAQVQARYEADGRHVPGFSETLLSAYESGHKRPGTEYLHYLCASYGADPAELGFEGRCLCGRSHRASAEIGQAGESARGALAPRIAAGPERAAAPDPRPEPEAEPTVPLPRTNLDEDSDELRAMLVRQMAEPGSPRSQVDSRFLGAVDRIRSRVDEALLSGTVSAALLDRWEQGALSYGLQYMTVPPLRLLCDVLLDLAEVRRMWAERQPLYVSERLCRLASQLAGIAGIAMLDLGDHRLARSLFRTARTAADETGDRQLRAWVAVRESLVPLYFGDPREAADLAAAAADLAGRHACAAAVMAPVVRARAQARMISPGQSRGRAALERAKASLDHALDAFADLPADQRADTALGYTERQLHFHAGDILVTLGDWQAAHRAFGRANELYASTEVLDRALVAFGQARCLLAADEPDQALALGRDVLTGLPAEHRTAVIGQVARSFGRDAARCDGRLPALAGYREALHSA